MLLALGPPLALLFCALMLDLILGTLGLEGMARRLPSQLASGLLGLLVLWMVVLAGRAILRDSEQMEAERLARDTLLREHNPELWRARQAHEETVRTRTNDILLAMRQRPWHVRLQTLWRT